MKKLLTIITLLATALSLSASEPKKRSYTNLYEKIPAEGTYVGFAGVELLSPGSFGYGGVNFGITTSHGFMLSNRLFLGLGTGYVADFNNKKGLIPIFADGRFYFPSQYQRRIYPHLGARLGAEIATQGGVGGLFQLALGFRIPFSDSFAMNIEVGPQYSSKYTRGGKEGETLIELNDMRPFKTNGGFFSFFGRVNFEF